MFEHLDDPVGFAPDPQLHQAAVARGRRLGRLRRVAVAATGMTLVLAVVGTAGALYVARRDAAIDRADVATEQSLDGATNVLLVGTDARPGLEGARADTIAVVRVEPDGSVKVLSLPRDLIDPETGQRLSAAMSSGGDAGAGRQALIDAVTRLTGIPVHRYVELDFEGFVALVDEVGGLRLAVDVPLRDEHSGLLLEPSPCATLDGETALALIRARHIDGDVTGDIGRMARTQAMLAAVGELRDVGRDPVELDRLSRVLADHAVVDDALSFDRMVSLGRAVAGGPGVVQSATVPLVRNPADGATVVLAPDAGSVFQQFGAPAPDAAEAPGGPSGAGGAPVPTDVPTGIRPC